MSRVSLLQQGAQGVGWPFQPGKNHSQRLCAAQHVKNELLFENFGINICHTNHYFLSQEPVKVQNSPFKVNCKHVCGGMPLILTKPKSCTEGGCYRSVQLSTQTPYPQNTLLMETKGTKMQIFQRRLVRKYTLVSNQFGLNLAGIQILPRCLHPAT